MSGIENGLPILGAQPGTRPLVYDLRIGEGAGESYFAQAATFSERVVDEIEQRAGAMLDRCMMHLLNFLRESPASRGEVAIDLVGVGAAIVLYAGIARRVPGWVLRELHKLRWESGRPAVTADILRSALSGAFMKADHGSSARTAGPEAPEPQSMLEGLPHLIEWLQCTGDLAETSRPMINYLSVLRTLPSNEAHGWIETVCELFHWFESAAEEALGKYTRGVTGFLQSRMARSPRRKDRFLCGQLPVEYHLAMVAAAVANQDMRRAFARCRRKVVMVPGCMRGMSARACPAGQTWGLDAHCSKCDLACRVHRITEVMEAFGPDVYLENCPLNVVPLTARWRHEPHTGVVVVTCIPTMRVVQLATRAAGMTCQFLPLDFPGCQSHWRKARIPTTLNEKELIRMVRGGQPGAQ